MMSVTRVFLYTLIATIYGVGALPVELEKRALKDLTSINGVILRNIQNSPETFNLVRSASASPSAFGTIFNVAGGTHAGAFAKVVLSAPKAASGESTGSGRVGGAGVVVQKPPSEGSDDFVGGSSGNTRRANFDQEIAITKLVTEKAPALVGKFIASGTDAAVGRAPEDIGNWLVTEAATVGGFTSLIRGHPAFTAPMDATHCAQLADIATKAVAKGLTELKTASQVTYSDFKSLGNLFMDTSLTRVKFIDFGNTAVNPGTFALSLAEKTALRNAIIKANCPANLQEAAVACTPVVKRDLEGRAVTACAPKSQTGPQAAAARPVPVRKTSTGGSVAANGATVPPPNVPSRKLSVGSNAAPVGAAPRQPIAAPVRRPSLSGAAPAPAQALTRAKTF